LKKISATAKSNSMVNYISQLTAVITKFAKDERLNTAHVSLYLALFQFWNLNRFENPISLNRSEVMRVSKIGSKTTYHRCITELSEWGYLKYMPSKNPMKGSTINMYTFGTSSGTSNGQAVDMNSTKYGQVLGQVVVPSINSLNNTKQSKTERKGELHSPVTPKTQKRFLPPSLEEVKDFFSENKSSLLEAEKYYNHFESNGWKVAGKTPMKNWKAAAKNWMIRAYAYWEKENPTLKRLHVNPNTNYDEPL
jgi:hypothetical protein